MDPQQRLMLELAWEALEDAGIPPDRSRRRRGGRLRGRDLERLRRTAAARRAIAVTRQVFTGTQRSMIANRVSYFLGARGPSLTVDTGQSSGLVSVHMACESLRAGESTHRPGRRGQPQCRPGQRPRAGGARSALAGRALLHLRRAGERLRARGGGRPGRPQAVRRRRGGRRPDPGRDPRQRRQQRRWWGWAHRARSRRAEAAPPDGLRERRGPAGPGLVRGAARHRHAAR